MKYLYLLIVLSAFAYSQEPASRTGTTAKAPNTGFPNSRQGAPVENAALLPSLPPLPQGQASLLGGTISNLDRVREALRVQVFGGGESKILFDERTHIYVDGKPARSRDLRDGQRAHFDTTLDGTKIFARNIYVVTQTPDGDDYGAVESYNPRNGELVITDALAGATMRLQLPPGTVIRSQKTSARTANIRPGSLVSVKFRTDGGGRAVAHEVVVLAEPGDVFHFLGSVTYLNLSKGMVVIEGLDGRRYELYCDRSLVLPELREGSKVEASARFDGTRYVTTKLVPAP